MTTKEAGDPAFPLPLGSSTTAGAEGMTLRQYAAIKLKVPDSGTDWLDEMIRQSLRDDLTRHARATYDVADAMMEASK